MFRLNVSLCQLIPIYYSSRTQNIREKNSFFEERHKPKCVCVTRRGPQIWSEGQSTTSKGYEHVNVFKQTLMQQLLLKYVWFWNKSTLMKWHCLTIQLHSHKNLNSINLLVTYRSLLHLQQHWTVRVHILWLGHLKLVSCRVLEDSAAVFLLVPNNGRKLKLMLLLFVG